MANISYYLFITSDGKASALDICLKRLEEKKWPIYERTKFRDKLSVNDKIIFYIAGTGPGRQSFIASANINNIVDLKKETTVDPDKSGVQIFKYIELNNMNIFKKKIIIDEIINELNFIENKKNYGLYFVSGVSKIDELSFNLINERALR
jgi:predicted RNA-binding protein